MSVTDNDILSMHEHGQNSAASTLHLMFRFLRTVRLRSGILVASLIVSCIGGAAYFITAQRIYQSNASLYIVRKGGNISEETQNNGSSATSEMPTFIELMSRDKVIVGAIQGLPKTARVDLVGVPEALWVKTIKDNLSVSCAFSTTVLDLSYRSKDPKAAQGVLAQMLKAYEIYLDSTHNGSSEESIRKLKEQQASDEERLDQAIAYQLQLRASAPELVETGEKNSGLSIVSETIRLLNTAYSEAHRTTERTRTQIDGVQRAIASNEDILQFANEALDSAGRQIIEQSMGLGSQDAFITQRTQQDILDLESQRSDARTRYGEQHSKIKALNAEILNKQKFLQDYPRLKQLEVQRMARTELAPRLVQYLRQQLETNLQDEQAIYLQLENERNKAQRLGQILADLQRNEREISRLNQQIEDYQNKADGIGINKDKMIITNVARSPTFSGRPVNPRLAITGMLSLMLGSITGIGIIWVLDIMDDRFRTPEELKLQLETQVLSMIPRMDELQGEGFAAVMCHSKPHSKEVEAFRALRTSIEQAQNLATERQPCLRTWPWPMHSLGNVH
jgi:polysaccharide biosynthesis transport protein